MAKKKPNPPKKDRPFDPVIGSFAASHGYLDEGQGHQNNRARVAKMWGKQYLRYYELGREDARKHRGTT